MNSWSNQATRPHLDQLWPSNKRKHLPSQAETSHKLPIYARHDDDDENATRIICCCHLVASKYKPGCDQQHHYNNACLPAWYYLVPVTNFIPPPSNILSFILWFQWDCISNSSNMFFQSKLLHFFDKRLGKNLPVNGQTFQVRLICFWNSFTWKLQYYKNKFRAWFKQEDEQVNSWFCAE